MYKLIRDNKFDRAMAYFAGVNEIMALCMHILEKENSKTSIRPKYAKEVFNCLKNVLYSYTRGVDEERFQIFSAAAAVNSKENNNNTHSQSRPQTAFLPTCLATRLCLVVSSTPHMIFTTTTATPKNYVSHQQRYLEIFL